MAYIWLDGFEHQVPALEILFNFGTNADALAYDTNDVGNGISYAAGRISGQALRIEEDGTNATNYSAGFAATQNATLSIWVRMPSGAPGTNSVVLTLRDSGGNQLAGVRFSTTGTIDARAGTGTFDTGPSITDGNWHRLDLWADTSCTTFGGTTWGITWAVDGSSQGTATQGTHVATNMESIQLGSSTGSHNAIVEFDDAVLTNDGTDYPLGSHEITFFVPTSDVGTSVYGTNGMEVGRTSGTPATGTDLNGTTVEAWPLLDDWPTTGADWVQENGVPITTEHADVGFDDHPDPGTIVAVRAIAALNSSGGTANNGIIRVRDASDNELGTIYSGDMSDTEQRYQAVMVTEPGGGWATDFGGIKVAMGFSTTQGSVPRWHAVGLMVATASQDANATPSTIAAVAALTTPTVTANASATPSTIAGVAAIATPSIAADAKTTPETIPAVVDIPTPTIGSVTDANATPATIQALVAIPTPSIQVTSVTGSLYAFGYGEGGYIPPTEEEPPPAPEVVEPPSPTPELSVLIDFITDTGLAADPRWVELVDYLRAPQGFVIRRGRQRELDRVEAGTATLVFGDPDRLLDPDNENSPFYPFVVPYRRIKLAAVIDRVPFIDAFTTGSSTTGGDDAVGGGESTTRIPLFDGLIESFQYDYPGPGFDATVTVDASDWLGALSRDTFSLGLTSTSLLQTFPLYNYAIYSMERIHVILDQKEWAYRRAFPRDRRELDGTEPPGYPASKQMQMLDYSNAGMLESIQQAVEVDGGNFFCNADGELEYLGPKEQQNTLQNRWTFSRAANRFADVQWIYDDALIYNDIQITSQFGVLPSADTKSQRKYLKRSLQLSIPFNLQADMQIRATELLARYAEPFKVIRRLDMNSADDWEIVLSSDLWQTVLVEVELPNGDIVEQLSLVEGIEIVSPHEKDWKVGWWLSLARFPEILDNDTANFEFGIGTWHAVSNCSLAWGSDMSTYQVVQDSGPNGLPRTVNRSTQILPQTLYIEEVLNGDVTAATDLVGVEPNRPYHAAFDVYQVQLGTSTFTTPEARLQVWWYDSNQVFLSQHIGDWTELPSVVSPIAGFGSSKVVKFALDAQAPPGAYFAQLVLQGTDMPDLQDPYPRGIVVDNASLRRRR